MFVTKTIGVCQTVRSYRKLDHSDSSRHNVPPVSEMLEFDLVIATFKVHIPALNRNCTISLHVRILPGLDVCHFHSHSFVFVRSLVGSNTGRRLSSRTDPCRYDGVPRTPTSLQAATERTPPAAAATAGGGCVGSLRCSVQHDATTRFNKQRMFVDRNDVIIRWRSIHDEQAAYSFEAGQRLYGGVD
jgi:hypothetical protein